MSRINRVEVQEFAFELPDLGFDAGGFNIVYQPKNRLKLSTYAIAIEADDGARGEYVALWGGTKMALSQTLALAPHLLRRDPHQRELIYDDFKRALRQYDRMGVGCIDIALWDLAGKQLNAPIWKMLGGWRKRLPTVALATKRASSGTKIRCATGGWSQHAHKKLRQFIKTPLLQTEHVRGVEPKADFIVNDATDFVRADPEYDLGITGTMKIAHLTEAFGLDVEIHAPGPAHRHCMAAIRNTNYYELALVGPKCGNAMPPVYADGYSDELASVGADGCFPVPDGPGLSVVLRLGIHQKA